MYYILSQIPTGQETEFFLRLALTVNSTLQRLLPMEKVGLKCSCFVRMRHDCSWKKLSTVKECIGIGMRIYGYFEYYSF